MKLQDGCPSLLISLLLVLLSAYALANRVYELSEKFVDAYQKDTKSWLVKFYAPWCHHCKQMEPIYMQVAQKLHNEDIGIYVGRMDCTRFTVAASHFSIKGFPTLMFVSKDKIVEYQGDRSKEEIMDFAKRLLGPKVRSVADCNDLKSILDLHKVYFVFFGEVIPGEIVETIDDFHSLNWFYQSKTICPGYTEGLHAIKGPLSRHITHKFENDTKPIREWIKEHRFPQYVKVTMGNFNYLLNSGKILVIAVVEEYHSVGKLVSSKHEEFRDLLEKVSAAYNQRDKFVFGWSSQVEMLNSVAMQTIQPLPRLMVINSTTMRYHILDEEAPAPQDIINLLDGLLAETVLLQGGDSYLNRIYRGVFESISSLASMYKGNPILTLLLLGLPFAFLSIIVYTSCCTDILDAREEDEEELLAQEQEQNAHHEKHD